MSCEATSVVTSRRGPILKRRSVQVGKSTASWWWPSTIIGWLDDKMAAFGNGKLVPPARVLTEDLSSTLEIRLHRQITERILREAGIEEKVAAALQAIDLPLPAELHRTIGGALLDQPEASWRAAIERLADRLVALQDDADASPESRP